MRSAWRPSTNGKVRLHKRWLAQYFVLQPSSVGGADGYRDRQTTAEPVVGADEMGLQPVEVGLPPLVAGGLMRVGERGARGRSAFERDPLESYEDLHPYIPRTNKSHPLHLLCLRSLATPLPLPPLFIIFPPPLPPFARYNPHSWFGRRQLCWPIATLPRLRRGRGVRKRVPPLPTPPPKGSVLIAKKKHYSNSECTGHIWSGCHKLAKDNEKRKQKEEKGTSKGRITELAAAAGTEESSGTFRFAFGGIGLSLEIGLLR